MDSARWTRLWSLFDTALDQAPAQRAAWALKACESDPELAAELDDLLRAHAAEDALLDRNVATDVLGTELRAGETVDRYRVLRLLGAGGMGRVYLVERDDGEFSRRCALKVLAPGFAHPALIQRFRRERQIMAGLDHPGIAHLLDGGQTQSGLPYLVMDYVEGEALDRYFQSHQSTLAQRLRILCAVCDAVDYAHRRLVVHRDLKPGNILVTRDGRPVLLDFGIAKLLDPSEAGDQSELLGLRPLTLRYASPEQLAGAAVDTASDVYSLGLLLFEVISGKPAYFRSGESGQALLGRIRQDPLPSLTDTLRTSRPHGETGSGVAVAERVPAEIDWIVMRALHGEPERRYTGAAALAADLRALLEHRPLSARPDTLLYRTGKFLRRRWAATAVVALFLIMGLGFTLSLGIQTERTREALVQAQQARDRTEAVADFLRRLFRSADSTHSGGRDIPASELLARGREQLQGQRELDADTRVALLDTLAEVHSNLGDYDQSLQLLEQAEVAATSGSADHLLAQLNIRRGSLHELRGEHRQAREYLQRGLEQLRAVHGEDSLEVASASEYLGVTLQSLGQLDTAGQMFLHANQLFNRLLEPDDPRLANNALRMGSWHWMDGRLNVAETWYAQALQLRRAGRPVDQPELARAIDALAAAKHAQGHFDAAIQSYREAVALRRQVLGNEHRHTADSLSNLGACLYDAGSDDEAESALREALQIYDAVVEPDSTVLSKTLNNLGLVRQRQGDLGEAGTLFDRALQINLAAYGEAHRSVAGNLNNLGLLAEVNGDLDGAERYLRRALASQETALGSEHHRLAYALTNLGRVLLWKQHADQAMPLLQRASSLRDAKLSKSHPARAETLTWLGYGQCLSADLALVQQGIDRLSEARQIREQRFGADAGNTRTSQALHALCRLQTDQTGAALAELDAILPVLTADTPASSPLLVVLRAARQQADAAQPR